MQSRGTIRTMIAKKIPLLIVRLSTLNVITPTWCLDHQNQMPNLYLCLELHLKFPMKHMQHDIETCATSQIHNETCATSQ
jgi:hypothetical protein